MSENSGHLYRAELYHLDGDQVVVEVIRHIRSEEQARAIERALRWAEVEAAVLVYATMLRLVGEDGGIVWSGAVRRLI